MHKLVLPYHVAQVVKAVLLCSEASDRTTLGATWIALDKFRPVAQRKLRVQHAVAVPSNEPCHSFAERDRLVTCTC